MQLIAVDIGNSSIKIAADSTGEDDRWTQQLTIRNQEEIEVQLDPEPAFWSICSVNSVRMNSLMDWVECHRPDDKRYVIEESDIELASDVESRSKVGRDRLVAAEMALHLNDQGPVIVVDAGTAVTIDLIDAQNIFQGGVIFPGAVTTLKSLSDSTDALPDLSDRKYLELLTDFQQIIGKSTYPAIVRGVYHTQIGGIQYVVESIQSKLKTRATVFATGGGIFDLQSVLPEQWNFADDLVLQGAKLIGKRLLATRK